jgi:DNA-binding response OmpR family regulator
MTPQETRAGILVVEDNPTLRSQLQTVLTYEYRVFTARNGTEGFDVLSRHHAAIDLVLTDINMPKMSGLDLVTRISQTYPALHVLVMTGFESLTMDKKLFQRNVIDYLKKPFSIAQLTERLEYALGKRQPQGFQGDVQVMGLTEIVQLYCTSRATLALTVVRQTTHGEERGVIYFENGMITHALCGEKLAQAAFFYIMTWTQGAFSTSYGTAAAEQTIFESWEMLTLEAARRGDEDASRLINT